jgi:hypothetical protein
VVQIPSHGGSGVVVWTGPGQTHVVSAAHLFEGGAVRKPIRIAAPSPEVGPPRDMRVTLSRVDPQADLSFLVVHVGPWPYVCPIATSRVGTQFWSVGYDEMCWPAKVRPATVYASGGGWTYTRERPWHGRSGGGLIDPRNGVLVGIVSSVFGPDTRDEVVPGGHGRYVSLEAIQAFVGWQHRTQGFGQKPDPDAPRRPFVTEQFNNGPLHRLPAPPEK